METTQSNKTIINDILESFAEDKLAYAKKNRINAIQRLDKSGLPNSKSEEYRFTPIAKNLQKNFSWSVTSTPSSIDKIDGFLIEGIP
jgi:hypothetical protein